MICSSLHILCFLFMTYASKLKKKLNENIETNLKFCKGALLDVIDL